MFPPDKNKKKANGQTVGASGSTPIIRTPEEEARADKAAKLAKTTKGKEHMVKVGVNLDKSGNATAKKFEKKLIKGDREKGTKDKYVDGKGRLIQEDTSKTRGEAAKKFKRTKAMTEASREKGADAHRAQTQNAKGKALDRKIADDVAGGKSQDQIFTKGKLAQSKANKK